MTITETRLKAIEVVSEGQAHVQSLVDEVRRLQELLRIARDELVGDRMVGDWSTTVALLDNEILSFRRSG